LAEDIIQDVFLKLIHSATGFDVTKKFSTWVYTVVKNASLNKVKTNQRQLHLNMQHFTTSGVDFLYPNMDARLIQKTMHQIIRDMTEKDRLVYTLRIEQQLSIKEVAEIAELPEGSVKSTLFYVLKKISNQLKVFTHE
jgi:RNA polymerase sigma-70 factor, ECF subfamily